MNKSPQPTRLAQPFSASTPPAAGPRVLILDDDVAVASIVGEMLELFGYQPVVRNQGIAALDYLGREPVDVILCDFTMPEMDGGEFFSEVGRRHPSLSSRVVFLTGDVTHPGVREQTRKSGNPPLAKPFQLDSIRRTVADVLARAETASQQPAAVSNR